MGGSMYCRTCAAIPGHTADNKMIDIFANAKIVTLLNTLKEWQLDITPGDRLPHSICEKCELALMQMDKFRVQAFKAKTYLQSQLLSLETTTTTGYADAISDNENDLEAETNCGGGVKTFNGEAILGTFSTVLTEIKAVHVDQELSNNTTTSTNEKENEEQLNSLESGLIAVNGQTGELSFDSNIESSRPPDFQVVLIEEEEHIELQWINEDENAVEKGVQITNNESSECSEHMGEFEAQFDINNNSADTTISEHMICNSIKRLRRGKSELSEKGGEVFLVNNIPTESQEPIRRSIKNKHFEKNEGKEKSCTISQNHKGEENRTTEIQKHNVLSDVYTLSTSGDLEKTNQLSLGFTQSQNQMSAPTFDAMDFTAEHQAQINEFEALLAAINKQVASFESSKEPNMYSIDELQSVLMSDLTLQMIDANVNILEEDLQIDEFESLLASVDEQASTLGSIRSFKRKTEPAEAPASKDPKTEPSKELANTVKILPHHSEMEKNGTTIHTPMCDKKNIEPKTSDTCATELLSNVTLYAHDQILPSVVKRIDCVDNASNESYRNADFEDLLAGCDDNGNTPPLIDKAQQKIFTAHARSDKKLSNKFRCRLCVYKVSEQPAFDTAELLEEHITSIHDDKERPYNCPQCAARYRTRSGCVAHINAIHLKKGDSCELCGKVVAGGSGQMRMHMERNHTHGNYTCEICNLELKNVSLYNFKYHKRWHNEEKLWRCELCEKAFVTRTHLMAHKVKHTRQGEFLCTRCGKSTRSKWELRAHLYAIHGEGEAPLKCNYCDEKFTQHIQKRAHLERYHPIELAKRTVPCPKCEKQFSTDINLHRHIKQHHQQGNEADRLAEPDPSSPPQYEGFMCAHCPRKYRSKYALIKHLGVHAVMADRPYSCPDCAMHFKHFSELDRHDLQHHADVRPYRCEKCPKAFSTRTALKIHGQVHEVKGRNFRCPDCNQRFKFEKSLNLHRISHKTMRHSCDICNKSYIRLTQLKTHKKRFHKVTSASEEE
ncbi:zinc finger protein 37-like isoform X1 [Rhagoletis pomonella]|uniref:zinc finger protein 37-like isoform X1 n=1 Tax=Rhagoletis pomonella TaxID=28610 RepID=UPI0017846B1A|nr:zinc finger protein 37-like isoform X1 [Rhagoletis pomonella]